MSDVRLPALPDIHGHAKGEHKAFADERPIPYTARLIFLWFYHAARRGMPRFMMVTDHINYLTFEDPAAVNLVRRALRLALAGDLYGTAETAGVDIGQATVVSEALRAGMRFTIGAEVDNDPRSRPDAPNVVDAMRPDGIVRSIHFLPITHPDHNEEFFWPFDNPEFLKYYDDVGVEETWERYAAILTEAIATQPTHIVGHFYVPGKFGHWPETAKLEVYEDRLVEICKERSIAIEFNSRIFYRSKDEALKAKHIEAYARLMRKAKEHGVGVALGSDAHSPKDQGNGFNILLPLLDAAEINEIVFPIAGQQARVALRADKAKRSSSRTQAAARRQALAMDESEPSPRPPEPKAVAEPPPDESLGPAAAESNPRVNTAKNVDAAQATTRNHDVAPAPIPDPHVEPTSVGGGVPEPTEVGHSPATVATEDNVALPDGKVVVVASSKTKRMTGSTKATPSKKTASATQKNASPSAADVELTSTTQRLSASATRPKRAASKPAAKAASGESVTPPPIDVTTSPAVSSPDISSED